VKRIIGIPGDRVALYNNQLLINQKPAQYKLIAKNRDFTLSEEYIGVVVI
jgi:signal peptidase I